MEEDGETQKGTGQRNDERHGAMIVSKSPCPTSNASFAVVQRFKMFDGCRFAGPAVASQRVASRL
jgi:hypothetical protein